MKKRILSLALVVALVMVAVAGATMAYFTDTEQAVNVATVGNVSIKQHEQERAEDGTLQEFTQGKGLSPAYATDWTVTDGFWTNVSGALDKIVTVENDGASDTYFRTWIAYECPVGMTVGTTTDADIIISDNSSDYTVQYVTTTAIGDNTYAIYCYTYNEALASGATSEPSLVQFAMSPAATNAEAALIGETYEILVFTQAVQTDNFSSNTTALTEAFGNDIPWAADFKASDVFHVSTSEEMEAAMDSTAATVIINLEADVSYDVSAWSNNSIGGANTQIVQIEGNGHTLTFNHLNSDWNNVIMTNEEGTLILKDLHLTNSGKNNGPWNRHDVNFACNVVLENVTSDKAVAVKADAKLTNVTITDTGDVYGLWIQANGQTVDLENVTIATGNKASMVATAAATESGRGIKIADEYVDAPASVTLNVNNSAFFTGKKAAVLVTSTAGADITFTNSNILGCSADPINPVWVDEDRADYASQVTVNGGNAVVEGSADIIEDVAVVGGAEELKDALQNSDYVILSGDVSAPAAGSNGYGKSGYTVNNTVLDGNGNTLDVSNSNGTWDSAINTTGGTIQNVTITGAFRGIFIKSGANATRVYLNNVVSTPGAYTISCDQASNQGLTATNCTFNGWTSFAKTLGDAEFINCHFDTNGSYKYMRPYAPTVLEGCTFCAGYALDATRTTVTLKNCYVGDTLITAENITSLLGSGAANAVVSNG